MTCPCGPQWRVYAANLKNGMTRATLPVVSMDLGETLNKATTGTLVLNAEDVSIVSVWPHLTAVWVTRGGDIVWCGMIEAIGVEDNTLTVGMVTLDAYLNRRNIREHLAYSAVPQTVIGAALVNYIQARNGIRLFGASGTSTQPRDRTFEPWDRTVVGQAIQQLTEVSNGPDWVMRRERDPATGAWTATMDFVDVAGGDRGVVIIGGTHTDKHSLQVDAKDHATLIDAIGAGEEQDMLIATAENAATSYPQFDATPPFKDVLDMTTLMEHAQGALQGQQEPYAVPRLTLVDHSLQIGMGDIVTVDSGWGAGTFRGRARVVGWTWRAAAGEADRRELSVVPLDSATAAMLGQVPRDCPPG